MAKLLLIRAPFLDLALILSQNVDLFLVKIWSTTLANSRQAKKRARQNDKRRAHNASARSEMRTYIKQVAKALQEGNASLAADVFKKATSMVDRLASKGLIHKNKAARHKSRLNAQIKAKTAAQK